LERLVGTHDAFLEGLDHGKVFTAEEIDEWRQMDSDEAIEELLNSSGADSTSVYRVKELREYVSNDRSLLDKLHARAVRVKQKDDPKLKALVDEGLKPILRQAKKEAGGDEADFRRKRKVIIFSYYSNTVDWIFEHLQERFDNDQTLRTYRGRLVAVAGDEATGGVDREEAVFRFAPESSEAPPGYTDDFDVLVTTDVLAEGMNLQDCRNIINYDLPWNPMRLVQRHGRVDRLGSPHQDVYVGCFFPDARMEELLDLEARIRRKVAQGGGYGGDRA
jgi:superfamily II DNA/RNA helicase